MTKEDLFKKYGIDESHSTWDEIVDRHFSLKIHNFMHQIILAEKKEKSFKYVLDFLDGFKISSNFMTKLVTHHASPEWENMYMTAKKTIYKFHQQIILEICTQI